MPKGRDRKKPTAASPPKGKRQPVKAVDVRGGKHPVAVARFPNDLSISWRLGGMDMGGPWSWDRMAQDTALHLHAKLACYETMTWADLINSTHNKRVPVEHLCQPAQNRLIELGRDDLDNVWELRVSGKRRIWGWRVGDVMHLLWWDPDHEVCPAKLKHT